MSDAAIIYYRGRVVIAVTPADLVFSIGYVSSLNENSAVTWYLRCCWRPSDIYYDVQYIIVLHRLDDPATSILECIVRPR